MMFKSLALLHFLMAAEAFVVQPSHPPVSACASSGTELYGKVRRGGLGRLAGETGTTPSKVRKTARTKNTKKASTDAAAISPALAEWMAQQDQDGSPTTPATVVANTSDDDDDNNDDSTVSFKTFDKDSSKSPSRRVKQGVRKEMEDKRLVSIAAATETLTEALEQTNNLDGILAAIRQLISVPSGNLRMLLAGGQKYNYRLAWVGSDDAICHVGTGLHKVPLARLQEVFLTCMGKNRLELLEVIRILGPFPNVKNILQGDCKVDRGEDIACMKITYDSMIDGTGKEVLAGEEGNVRRVGLQVYFADEEAIVAVVPPESGFRDDPLEVNGSNVLVFIREKEMDEKLDALRVS
jgi:hypothetical protein